MLAKIISFPFEEEISIFSNSLSGSSPEIFQVHFYSEMADENKFETSAKNGEEAGATVQKVDEESLNVVLVFNNWSLLWDAGRVDFTVPNLCGGEGRVHAHTLSCPIMLKEAAVSTKPDTVYWHSKCFIQHIAHFCLRLSVCVPATWSAEPTPCPQSTAVHFSRGLLSFSLKLLFIQTTSCFISATTTDLSGHSCHGKLKRRKIAFSCANLPSTWAPLSLPTVAFCEETGKKLQQILTDIILHQPRTLQI